MLARLPFFAAALVVVCVSLPACASSVTAHVVFDSAAKLHSKTAAKPQTVMWLKPADKDAQAPAPGRFTMVQQNRMFTPHLLVMPVGSTVSFPNKDPFFHNVFSFFNGRRFDLGLYQSGQSRDVVFNRVGVSYIFCNIHPEMSAVIITLDTPYFAVSDDNGDLRIPDVPAGSYTMQVWSESISPEARQPASRKVIIGSAEKTDLGAIPVHTTPGTLSEHLNKFGEPYDTHAAPAY
jgi:plastocyanin